MAVTAFGQAFARYQDPMDAGSPMRTRGLSVSFCYVFLIWSLSIMRAAPVSLWSSLRFTLSFGYVLHELLYPFGSFISFLIPGTVISGGECKDPGSY